MKQIKKLDKKEYYKQYYLKNKNKMKDTARKQYLRKKGIDEDIKIEVKTGKFLINFD